MSLVIVFMLSLAWRCCQKCEMIVGAKRVPALSHLVTANLVGTIIILCFLLQPPEALTSYLSLGQESVSILSFALTFTPTDLGSYTLLNMCLLYISGYFGILSISELKPFFFLGCCNFLEKLVCLFISVNGMLVGVCQFSKCYMVVVHISSIY